MAARLILSVMLVAVLSGCLHTAYRKEGPAMETEAPLERQVVYGIDRNFHLSAPDCTALRTRTPVPARLRHMVEQSVERHLATRFERVIGAARLRRAEARLGIDMNVPSDRRVFARQTRCRALVEIALHEISEDYLVLWSQRGISMTLTMTRLTDDKLLWNARHRASRGDGGLPFTLLSLPFSAARAARFKSDPEMFASMADDAVRRMMRTLPDTRGLGIADMPRR